MPAVAVIGGIATAAGAAAGASALIGGAFTLANVASGLAFVGGVASALGGITGNKKLMKFGMIAGLAGAAAGGIGSLMNKAGDVASNVAGSAASGIMGPPTELASMDSLGNMALSDTSNAVELAAVRSAGDSAGASGMLGSGLRSGGMTAETARAAAGAVNSAADPVSYALNDPAAINVGGGNFAPNTSSAMADASGQLRVPAATMPGSAGESMFGKFGSAIKNNPELAKTATGMLGGLGQSYMQQQQMKEQERLSAERRTRMNASILGQQSRF